MRKLLSQCLCICLVLLSACSKPEEPTADFIWSRVGYFTNEQNDTLMVYRSQTEGYEGWAVSLYTKVQEGGWIIQQEGETLKGDLTPPDTGDPYVVTLKEEGDEGILVITPEGKQIHFIPMQLPEIIGTVTINVQGDGQVEYVQEGEQLEFSDEFPFQSHVFNLLEPGTYLIGAKAARGWKFDPWKLDGEDYATREIITVELAGNADLVAVFVQE